MRAKGRKHGRFVALGGLKKVPGPPGSRFSIIIVDPAGLPVFYLSEWYRRKKVVDPGRTPDTYLEMLLPWAGFLLRKGYSWNDTPDQVRAHLVEFLRTDVGCHVSAAQEEGYLVETTGASPLSKSSLGVLLAALASLYNVLGGAGYYVYGNPMRSEQLAALKQVHLRHVTNAGAPDHAGIRSESHQETSRTFPTAFFRQKRGKVWEPEVVMEPDEIQERMRQVIDFMIQHATFQRDQVILLLLRQTGARLSEIIEMTAGGYRNARHAGRAFVKNKGSRGREEKPIYFTDSVERQLLHYIRTERARYDLQGRKRLEDLNESDPLFLTEDGRPYRRSAFYYHWAKLFVPAQKHCKDPVEFSPHDIRHLRVTRVIMNIQKNAREDSLKEAELLDGFRHLMGWRSQETMQTYIHTLKKRKALLELVMAEEEQEAPDTPPLVVQVKGTSQQPEQDTGKRPAFPPVPDEDEFGWYEEEDYGN